MRINFVLKLNDFQILIMRKGGNKAAMYCGGKENFTLMTFHVKCVLCDFLHNLKKEVFPAFLYFSPFPDMLRK